jgi:hypothetical protein
MLLIKALQEGGKKSSKNGRKKVDKKKVTEKLESRIQKWYNLPVYVISVQTMYDGDVSRHRKFLEIFFESFRKINVYR